MKSILIFTFLLVAANANSQKVIPDLHDLSKWSLSNRAAEPLNEDGKKGIRLSEIPNDGAMVLKDYDFSNGTIEFDVKGKNVLQRSFVGMAFHWKDSTTYDAIYFRPFNFVNPDTARRRRAVQYISMPNHPWEKLRQDHPGKYENAPNPIPDPDGWFHVRITVAGKQVKVYVNNASTPSLEVDKLTSSTNGSLALWVGNTSGGAFANLTITAQSTSTANTVKIPYGNNPEVGKYFSSGNARLYYEVYGQGQPILMLHGGVYGYISEFEYLIPKLAEHHQVICLATRGHGKSEIGKEQFTYQQRAQDAYSLLKHLNIQKAIVIGFSDGGYSGYKMAALYPGTVIKLVVMGAGDRKKDAATKPFNYNEADLTKNSGSYFEGLKKLMPEPQRWNESLQMLNKLYNDEFISTETFQKIKCPVLIMSGDRDDYVQVEKAVNAYKQIKGSMLSIIPGCGHVIFYCNFPAVWEAMQGFVMKKEV